MLIDAFVKVRDREKKTDRQTEAESDRPQANMTMEQ